jgi:Zn-dependent metalloprotease
MNNSSPKNGQFFPIIFLIKKPMHTMKRRIFTIVLLAVISHSYAQDLRETIRGERGISKHFVRLAADQQQSFNLKQIKNILNPDAQTDFVLINQQTDKLGFTHYRFYQTYKGIPVENSMYIIHTRSGKITGLSGEIVVDFDTYNNYEISASLSPKQAVDAAIKKVHAQKYMWQDAENEQQLKEQLRDAKATYVPVAKLVWFNAGDEINPRDLRLAYKVDVYAKQPLSRADYFIDAQTGKYLGKEDKIHFSDAVGTASTAYSGSQTIHSDNTGSSYRLRDYTKGAGIITRHGESGQRGSDYTSSSANWNLTGTSIAALDAHYGVSQTYAFYLANFNRSSYDGNGSALYSYVNDPSYIDNAFWDGSAMNFCKRSNSNTYPGGVTGIDVTGHELTHGVTQTTSGLNYSKEPGAMNESMSDIMGKSVQFWSKPSDKNWKMSNDMNWLIRDMSNPNAYGQPDTYKGTYWYSGSADNYGVHTNSGVGNFMFYLLVDGGSGTNDIGNSYMVSGIGLSKADQILYRTETVYLGPNSKYADWRTACINAATDLYGAGSNEVTQVENAWYAVGIGTAGGGGGGCSVPSGLTATNITNTSATLNWNTVSGALSYTLQWKVASGTLTTVNGLTSASYNLSGLNAATTYNYRVRTVCSDGTSNYSSTASFTTTGGSITYCTSKGSNSTYEWIKQITFGNINNNSGNNGGYGNYTGLSTSVTAGSTYRVTMIPGFSSGSYREYWTVYIDYNQNGTLNNSGETVVTGYTTGTGGGYADITIPTTAKNGATRMRIQMHYGSQVTNPCSTFDYGEVEDYTINISGGSGFAAMAPASQNATATRTVNLLVTPNPVTRGSATVTYNLANNGAAALKVFDLSGRTMQTIQLGNQSTGTHTYNLSSLSRLASGNYIIVLEQNARVIARNPFVITR